MPISRRELALATAGLAIPTQAFAQQAALRPTGQETFGPYYPIRLPRGNDTDLTHYPGKTGRARGQIIELTGRILDIHGRPLPRASILFWQANAAGRYVHPVDSNPAALDPNFLGIAEFGAGADGSYRLRTVKPGAYPEPSGTMRTPHLHFQVDHEDYRLATQMYFPGESLNATDILLSTLAARRRDPRAAICREASTSEPGVLAFQWDIVLLA